jgi:peptidyl-prolyl cis-trans isomerase SurA
MVKTMRLFLAITLLFSGTLALAAESLDQIVATVDNEVITENELQGRLMGMERQAAAAGQTLPKSGSEEHTAIKKQVLNSLIEERLQLVAAENYGITVDEASLNQAIASVAKQNNLDAEGLRKAVESDGYSYARFEADIRRDLLLSRLQQQAMANRVVVSDEEIDEFLKTSKHLLSSNQEYRVSHILLALPENPTPAELKAAQQKADDINEQLSEGASFSDLATKYSSSSSALKGGDLGWSKEGELPSLFATAVPKLKKGEVAKPIRNSSGLHIVELTDVRSEDVKQEVQQARASHILFKTTELVSDEEAELRLAELRKRVEAGESFADLAHAHSEDPGSARKGGELGWVDANSNLDETFFKELQKTPTGQISPPFKSAFGWHIIQVEERRQQDQTKEYQRNMARKMLQNSKFLEARQSWLSELRDASHVQIKDTKLQDPEVVEEEK